MLEKKAHGYIFNFQIRVPSLRWCFKPSVAIEGKALSLVTQKMTYPVSIREMRDSDLSDVLEIEKEAFPVPWTRDQFLQELGLPKISNCLVAEMGHPFKKVVGYACYSLILDEAHITNFAILKKCRRKKIGERLLQYLLYQATRQGAWNATLEVRVSNKAAHWLYSKFGFAPAGIRKAYYPDNKENALVMWADLAELASDGYSTSAVRGRGV